MQNENKKLIDLMKLLDIFTGQEIQASHKTVIKRFELTEELVRTDKQGKEVQARDLTSQVPLRLRDDLPRVLATYPVTTFVMPANNTQKYVQNLIGSL